MAILKIARVGHPILRQVADPLPPERIPDPQVQGLIDDMAQTLTDYEGAGLAAPQVHVPLRIVLLALEGENTATVLINPEISFLTSNLVRSYEGCLSVPDLRAAVNRAAKVRVDAFDRAGQRLSFEAEGFAAIAAQHECDHLDGVLFVDRCAPTTLTHVDELRRFGPLDPGFRKDPDPEREPQSEPEEPQEPQEPSPSEEGTPGAEASPHSLGLDLNSLLAVRKGFMMGSTPSVEN